MALESQTPMDALAGNLKLVIPVALSLRLLMAAPEKSVTTSSSIVVMKALIQVGILERGFSGMKSWMQEAAVSVRKIT